MHDVIRSITTTNHEREQGKKACSAMDRSLSKSAFDLSPNYAPNSMSSSYSPPPSFDEVVAESQSSNKRNRKGKCPSPFLTPPPLRRRIATTEARKEDKTPGFLSLLKSRFGRSRGKSNSSLKRRGSGDKEWEEKDADDGLDAMRWDCSTSNITPHQTQTQPSLPGAEAPTQTASELQYEDSLTCNPDGRSRQPSGDKCEASSSPDLIRDSPKLKTPFGTPDRLSEGESEFQKMGLTGRLINSIHHSLDRPGTKHYAFYQLSVHLKQGRDLVAKDSCGTSDPYVKFKVGGRLMYKSKTVYRDLNPFWDESFSFPVEDIHVPLHIKVFDYDWGFQDDFLGFADIDLSELELSKSVDLSLKLMLDEQESQGFIDLRVTLIPKTQEEKEQSLSHRSVKAEATRKLKSQIWSSVVTVVVIEAKNLRNKDDQVPLQPFVRFRLSAEKYKTKSTSNGQNQNPTWLEQFDMHLFDDQSQILELVVSDKLSKQKDDTVSRGSIDLSKLEREKTHGLWVPLFEGTGTLYLLLTISGTTSTETISDLTSFEPNSKETENINKRYCWWRSFHNLKDVGHLTVKVHKASGLASADLGGKSDPFCVLELVNSRLQTLTEYKTLNPSWQKIFTFNVKDINSVLEITVYDEDRDHKVEFLGKVFIPLLRIQNGVRKWYALKDKKLRSRARGNHPQILLELSVLWSPIRAVVSTLNPKELKYMEPEVKFNRHTFVHNVMRVKALIVEVIEWGKYIEGCWEWESPVRSIISLLLFVLITWYFQPFMIPLALLCVFLKNYLVLALTNGFLSYEEESDGSGDEDEDDDDRSKEEPKSLKERLLAIQEVTQTVQNTIGYLASLGESLKNVPFLSGLALLLLVLATIVLYLIPIRCLVLAWGVNRFMRKILRPHSIPNNELLDFLSRVPDDDSLMQYRLLRLEVSESEKRKKDNKKRNK